MGPAHDDSPRGAEEGEAGARLEIPEEEGKIIFEGEGRKYKMKKKDFGKKEKFKMKICRQHNFNENKNSPKRKKMTADE
jgi:hypothetical protein